MFEKSELATCNADADATINPQQYVCIICENEECSITDLSVFTIEEANCLKNIDEIFHERQIWQEGLSDDQFSWLFSSDNPKKPENVLYNKQIYWLDYRLKIYFGYNFRDIFLSDLDAFGDFVKLTKHEILDKHRILMDKYGKKNVSTDKLRKWFINNLDMIESQYNSVK
jgi:hypothetical protein